MKKTYKFILVSAAACISLASCNKWLDVQPSTEVDRDVLFATEAGFADAMSGVYAKLTDDNLYGKFLTWQGLELLGGTGTYLSSTNNDIAKFYFHPKSSNYKEYLRTAYMDPVWNEMYNAIANINSILEMIDDKKDVFEGDDYSIFKGEALGLRAFIHFDLLRLYAPSKAHGSWGEGYIPYVTELTSQVNAILSPEQFGALLIDDLTKAKELLQYDPMYLGTEPSSYTASSVTGNASYRSTYNIKVWHNRRFHFNYYAVVATMARVYQWLGDDENALECAKEIIDAQDKAFFWVKNQLVTNIESTSNSVPRDRTFSTEQIFALNITDLETRTDGYHWEGESAFLTNYDALGFDASAFETSTRSLDSRFAYLKTTFTAMGPDMYLTLKYRKDKDLNSMYSPWSANRLPIIRSSEMYYIAAECEPDLATATSYLEQVRSHRGLSTSPLKNVTDKASLQTEIENEYKKEFVAEGQYFYYIKRKDKSHSSKNIWEVSGTSIQTDFYTFLRPDDENTYGGRPSQVD